MASRVDFHNMLCSILGSNHVYFDPPENLRIEYPCIIYSVDSIDTRFADDFPYRHYTGYLVKYIDRCAESPIPKKLRELQMSLPQRPYPQNNLHYFPFKIYNKE